MFQVPRDRDAYAVIRGYVFQIDETVDTWLDLNAGELLELERGEDIDLVSRLIGERSRADVESRLLQQVKHRENNITLRTPAAIEAMVNFWDHRRLNPSVHLRFKFLTNAAAGAEQLSPFPERLPGITIWEQIRSHELRDGDASEAACQLREFLTKLPRPEPIPGSTWTDWQAFLTTESTDGFRTFIEQFEWRTSRPSASDIVGHLHKKIESHGIASSQTEAQAVYERLFFYVSRLLSTAGIKRLTVEQRTAVLGQPTLPAEDRETLSVLRNVVAAHGNRLDQVEDSVLALGARLERVLFQHAPSAHLYVADCPLDLTVPKNVARLSPRQATVDQLNTLREVTVWLSMHGGPDVGKSQLAIRIAAGHRNCAWIRFRHFQTSAEALSVLDAAMSALGGSKSHQHPTERYAAALSAVGPGSLIVLDDVPRIGSDDRFADRLALFARYAREAHVRILSTSQFELPLTIREYLGDALVHDCAAPSFTDDEAQDLFRAFSADSPFLESGQAKFLNRLAGGHPLLLAATAEFLAKRSWRFRDEDIDSLLRGDHTSRVLPEVIDRLTRTLAVPSRDLLYRLTLVFGPFEQSSVPTLADVLPSVDRPLERFNEILGTWVQRDTNLRFVVSPLVKTLGKTELAPAVRIDCHRALADAITDKGRMDQYDCERAIIYNLEAREFGRAATLYLLLLFAAQKEQNLELFGSVIDKWRETPLPNELNVGMRLTVRAYQLSAFARFRLDISYVLHDIDRLLDAATDADGWGVVALAVQAVGHLRQEDPARALRYVVRATQLSKLVGPTGEDIQLGGVAVPDLLWMLVADLGTPELLRQWLDAVEALSGPQLSNFWNSFIGEHGVWLVPNKLYLLEHEKPKTDQNWNAVVEALRQILDRTRRLAEPRLEATVTALMVDILGERNDLDAIRAIAEATLARWPNTDVVKLKVYGAWGRAYAHQGRRDLALPILDMALSAGGSGQDHERLRCLLAANLCVHRQELRYVERARRLAEASIGIPTLEAARALAEYAVSRFELDGGQAGAIAAFPEFSAAMRRLFATPARGRVWKDLVVLIGHAAGFLTSMAREARAPEHTMDGEPWVAPSRGFFSKGFSVERVDFYRAGSEAGLFSLMREYSIAASNVNDAAYWSKLAISESRRVGAVFVQAIASISSVAELLASGALEDAVEAGVFAGRALEVHHAMKPLTRENADGIGVDLEEELKKLGTDQRRHADSFSLISALVPAALWIARISTSDRGAAADASRRAAATCRQLAEENWGDPELWRASAAFFDLASEEQGNATPFLGRVRTIQGTDEAASALKTLGLILATPSASLSEAMHCQLTCVNKLLRWFLPHDTVYRLLMLPYIETFWQKAVDERRFLFRSPDVTCPAILAAIAEPEARRARAVLLAAAQGFEISRNLRVAVAELSESPKE